MNGKMANAVTDDMIVNALEHHRAGRLAEAEMLYRSILETEPYHIDVLYLMGLLDYETGRYDRAIVNTEAAINLDPKRVDAYKNLGNSYKGAGRPDAAIASYRRGLSLDPTDCELHYNLGVVFQEVGDLDAALSCYQKAIGCRAAFPEAYNNLGNVMKEKNRPDEALTCFRKAIELKPDFAEAFNNTGTLLQERGELAEARICYETALKISPCYAAAYNNLGNVFREESDVENAAAAYWQALRIDPSIADAYYSLGVMAYGSQDLEGAIRYTGRALEVNPDHTDALNNMGVSLYDTLDCPEAIRFYRRAIGLKPGFAEAHWNLSLALLLTGNFAEGWKEYEWRREMREIFAKRDLGGQEWRGEDLAGKRILVYTEQGFGDTIQFIRYARQLSYLGAEVLVECQKELVRLLSGVEGISAVYGRGEVLPPYDYRCPIMSLPGMFGTELATIPGEVPYIRGTEESLRYWRERLTGEGPGLKVGLSWAGRPTHKKDVYRTLKLLQYGPLGKVSGVRFYSLQKGEASGESKEAPEGMALLDYTGELNDFSDTAGLVGNLDLVISVDTAVVHLAGAMGKAVWTLLPYAPDWRWMLGRGDSPWYPTMRLFRQGEPGAWDTVMGEVAAELAAYPS